MQENARRSRITFVTLGKQSEQEAWYKGALGKMWGWETVANNSIAKEKGDKTIGHT